MAWMELHQEFYNHPKVRRFAAILKERVPFGRGVFIFPIYKRIT